MAKNSIDAYGAKGKGNLLTFDPDDLTLVTDETHPLYDERVHWPLNEAMVRNIDFQGVLQPIEVTKNPETGAIEVVMGRQRVKNAREANRRRRDRGDLPRLIPAFVRKFEPKERNKKLSGAVASENTMRQAETPLSRAGKMSRNLEYYTEAEVAMLFGCSVQAVRDSLSLLECCADVQKAVEAEHINLTHAKALAKMEPAEQRAKVKELIAAGTGVKGHAKARAQRAVIDGGAPRMRSRATIEAELAAAPADGERAAALRWVLGQD
ncbi:putative chromosome-partitioning protein ParB [Burkholderia glumae]|uniref:ParB/RepB/Spo0J family partition protein n=1 Tax=Burkholderia glumae TaxID=337 RepID=UPI001AE14013|nr:ParB N-terminal domain-containing protein [Burkholderia glumae]QTP32591.1 putative chromosome-partitioning protein ParB [Burkholderia glumae]